MTMEIKCIKTCEMQLKQYLAIKCLYREEERAQINEIENRK